MKDERLSHIDLSSWAADSISGAIREWTPKAPIRLVTSSTNVNPLDGMILVDASGGAVTLTLETAIGADGRVHEIKKTDSSSNAVTLDGSGSETIDGSATYSLSAQYDSVTIRSDGENWVKVGGVSSGSGVGGSGTVGQCRLTLDSGSLKLIPHKGNSIAFPDGTVATVAAAGVTLAATGLSVDTNYYIYATKSGTSVNALEASTTARATDSTTGIEIKNGDSTRVLVGLVRVVTGPAFVDDRERRYVRSWFNDQGVYLQGDNNSAATSSTSFVETDSTQRAQFLCWTNEPVDIAFAGAHSNNTAGSGASTSIGIDSSTSAVNISGVELQAIDYSNAANDLHSFCVRWCTTLSEGHHFVAGLIKAVTSGQASHNHGSISVHLAGAP